MTSQLLLAIALIVIGSLLGGPIVIVLGLVTLMVELVHALWAWAGLRGVRFARTLAVRRAAFGDEIPMQVEVWNRRRLPIPWLRADDRVSTGVSVRDHELAEGDTPGVDVLRNAWTLRPWERVIRRFHVGADRRGVFRLGPVDLSVGDPFARRAATEARPVIDTFIVWPRTLPTAEIEPPDRWGDLDRARSGLAEDPSRFAGVRPYVAGDPLRRIHARTSARIGRPMTKRFEPSRDRETLIALDVQTVHGPALLAGLGSEEVESLYVVAASLARTLGARRDAFGLMASGYTGAETRIARIAVSSAPGQVQRVLDLLARLSVYASAPFEHLLAIVARTAHPGMTVLVLTAREPRPFVRALRRLEQAGADVVVIACGPNAVATAAHARSLGFTARLASMDGSWRTAERLVIAP